MSFFFTNIVNWMFSNTLVRLNLYFSWIIFEIFVHSFTVFFFYWSFYFRHIYTCCWLVLVFHPKLKKESIVVESYFELNFLCGCRMDLYKWWKYYFSLSSQECDPFLVRPVCLSFKSLLFFSKQSLWDKSQRCDEDYGSLSSRTSKTLVLMSDVTYCVWHTVCEDSNHFAHQASSVFCWRSFLKLLMFLVGY